MEQKTCFVSMPFGKKPDLQTGRELDFDRVYREIVRPAAEETGYRALRADELGSGIIARPLFEQLLSSDVFIADVTTANPNVMYELGLRHALSNAVTLLVAEADWAHRLPFDLGYARVIVYRAQPGGQLEPEEATRARSMLSEAIRQGIGREGSYSPVYAFLQTLRPPELPGSETGRRRGSGRASVTGDIPLIEAPIESLRRAEEAVKSSPEMDMASVIEVMKGYQVKSAWEDLMKFVSDLPDSMKEVPQVAQMTALALNRLGHYQKAIAILSSLISRTGGDSETFGILGLSYKRLYASEHKQDYLQGAIDSYRQAFIFAPNDYYAGVNLASLLALYASDDARKELSGLVPRLRDQLAQRVEDPRADFWEVASALEMAVIARDWPEASRFVSRLVSGSDAQWALASVVSQLTRYEKTMNEPDLSQLQNLIGVIEARSGTMQSHA
jgi:tetratricopeptide (TPR) repeat protein